MVGGLQGLTCCLLPQCGSCLLTRLQASWARADRMGSFAQKEAFIYLALLRSS